MPDVLARRYAEQSVAARGMPGQLEIDKRRCAIVLDQDIGFLGQIVVHNVSSVQPAQ